MQIITIEKKPLIKRFDKLKAKGECVISFVLSLFRKHFVGLSNVFQGEVEGHGRNRRVQKFLFFICKCVILLMLSPLPATALDQGRFSPRQINTVVVDQFGKQHHFYEDLIKNKIVAINFIFISCTSSCPLSTVIFRQVQTQLKSHAVRLISISVDPDHDSPEDLLAYSKKFKTGSDWLFITGDKTNAFNVLKSMGVYSSNPNDHANGVIVGNDSTQKWVRLYGLPSANDVIAELKNVSALQKVK